MNKIIIEPYSEFHKDEVTNLIVSIQRNEFDIPISLEDQPDLNEIAQFYQINGGNFWIAKFNNKVIGTIALLNIDSHKGALRKMFVANEYRGKKFDVGRNLLNTLINWAKHKKMSEILLGTTEKFTRAQRFYEKNGFVEIQEHFLPKEFPIMKVDVKFYRLSLSS
jgi:N-acetylglutamate synthase-like GNAT family acetyltransferase